jgi:hypothetical protein
MRAQDVSEVLQLFEESRLLEADELLQKLMDKLSTDKGSPWAAHVHRRLAETQTVLDTLRDRATEVRETLHDVCGKGAGEEGWIHSSNLFGVLTSYKMDESGDGSIWVKLETKVEDLPLFEQVRAHERVCVHLCMLVACMYVRSVLGVQRVLWPSIRAAPKARVSLCTRFSNYATLTSPLCVWPHSLL